MEPSWWVGQWGRPYPLTLTLHLHLPHPAQLVAFHIPLSCYLSHLLAPPTPNGSGCGLSLPFIWAFLFFSSLVLQFGSVLTSSVYGTVAMVISPGITWPTILYLVLVFRALRIRYQLQHLTAVGVVALVVGGALLVVYAVS